MVGELPQMAVNFVGRRGQEGKEVPLYLRDQWEYVDLYPETHDDPTGDYW